MSKYYLYQDQDRCIGCLSCQIHCKVNKGLLAAGPLPSQIITVGPKMIHGRPKAAYIFMPCFHCERPWCVSACPTGAMQKRPVDGLVFVDPALCVGCKSCMLACPWGAPQWNPETRKVVKCDYCQDRLVAGQEPACVNNCVTKCLSFGEAQAAPNPRRAAYAKKIALGLESDSPQAQPGHSRPHRDEAPLAQLKAERVHGVKLPPKMAKPRDKGAE